MENETKEPDDKETAEEHDQPAVKTEHGIPEADVTLSDKGVSTGADAPVTPMIGATVQFFTDEEHRRSRPDHAGPYAAMVVAHAEIEGFVHLTVFPPFAPMYGVANVGSDESEERYWRYAELEML